MKIDYVNKFLNEDRKNLAGVMKLQLLTKIFLE